MPLSMSSCHYNFRVFRLIVATANREFQRNSVELALTIRSQRFGRNALAIPSFISSQLVSLNCVVNCAVI